LHVKNVLGLRLAAAALVVGGLVLGAAPTPLADYGCRPALAAAPPLDQSIEIVVACAEMRADRQSVVAVLLASGVAFAALSAGPHRAWVEQQQRVRHGGRVTP
jgi:hypothetical protein